MHALQEYIRHVVINELRVDKKFLGRLLQARVPTGFAARGRQLASEWIASAEAIGAQLTPDNKSDIKNYAAWRYAKIYHKLQDDSAAADKEIRHMLDVKYSHWLSTRL